MSKVFIRFTEGLKAAFWMGFFWGVSSMAWEAKDIRLQLQSRISQMRQAGIYSFGGTSIDDFEKKALSVQVEVLPFLRFENLNGAYRETAFWDKTRNKISFSEIHLNRVKPDHMAVVIQHEYAGMLGINDDNFSQTALVDIFLIERRIHQTTGALFKSERTVPFLRESINRFVAGGVSGVGGGGDLRVASYMKLIYSELIYLLDRQKISEDGFERFCRYLVGIKVEFVPGLIQGSFIFKPAQKILYIPSDNSAEENLDANFEGSQKFVSEVLESLDVITK